MRIGVNVFLLCAAISALQLLFPAGATAEPPPARPLQTGEERWVPSLAVVGGVNFQDLDARSVSGLVQGGFVPTALQPQCDLLTNPFCNPVPQNGSDLYAVPLVGGSLEIMTPALPIPTRPRFFLSADVIPTFASARNLALAGNPSCVSGPEPGAPCATDEVPGERQRAFGEDSANGQGTRTTVRYDTLTYGANAGVSFPLQFADRQFRIKPSVGWTSYKLEAEGFVVNAACDPVLDQCTDVTRLDGTVVPGFLREPESLSASASQRFHAIGPGLDFEMDTGRFGPIGSSLFLGGRAYYTLGDRSIPFGTTQLYDDQLGSGFAFADFEVEADAWQYRAHLGIRFMWLGN